MTDEEVYVDEVMPSGTARALGYFAKAETIYLAVLRFATLLIASGILIYLAWLLVAGIYNLSRNASSVTEAPAAVSAQELADMSVQQATQAEVARSSDPSKAQRQFYDGFLKRYHAIFAKYFESHRQASDTPLSMKQFDDLYVQSGERIAAIAGGDTSFETDQQNLNALLKVMDEAGGLATTQKALARYQAAKRIRVVKQVNKTRSERYCSYFGYYVGECLLYDTRQVPYTDTQVTYELPKGVFSYTDLFGRYQDNYLGTMTTRREGNRSEAERKREEILRANEHGKVQLQSALVAGGAFLALMFFFLLVAIERHQRKIAVKID